MRRFSFPLLLIFLCIITLHTVAVRSDSLCSTENPCAHGTGCCSKYGFCGFGDDFCGDSCKSQCDSKPAETTCSATKLCETGCCSKYGNCGWGDDFCTADNCLSGCDRIEPPPVATECSATIPCPLGCCSKGGYCGMGPNFCSADKCVNSCEAKSDCDAGWGMEWSKKSKCPLNVCCSKHGFCGYTPEFCGTKKVARPSCSKTTQPIERNIGYYESWGTERPCHAVYPENVQYQAYTHLNFAFAFIDPTTFEIAPMGENDERLYRRLIALKSKKPSLEVWIAIGGWSMNDEGPTRTTFSDLVGSSANQGKFFDSLVKFMTKYGFDGVDLDWEYPGSDDRGGRGADYANFPKFVKSLKARVSAGGKEKGVTVTLPMSYWYLQNFDVQELEKHVDWFNIMSYDLHGSWEAESDSKYMSPIVNAHSNLTEITDALDLLWRNNIAASKVVLGLAFYGRSFTLEDPKCNYPGCRYKSGGRPGRCSNSAGTLTNREIAETIKEFKLTPKGDLDAAVKMITWDDQWIAYDDAETLKQKVDFAKSQCLGGTMVWAISQDDFAGTSASGLVKGLGTGHSMSPVEVKTVNAVKQAQTSEDTTENTKKESVDQCYWTGCMTENWSRCNEGFSIMDIDGKEGETLTVKHGCAAGVPSKNPDPMYRFFCCPNSSQPKCEWRGSGGACNSGSGCSNTQVKVQTDSGGCSTGHKNICCSTGVSTKDFGKCNWAGSAGYCASAGKRADCPDGRIGLAGSSAGSGGEKPCSSGAKSLCCDDSDSPFSKCSWAMESDGKTVDCNGACNSDLGLVFMGSQKGSCKKGAMVLCCELMGFTSSTGTSTATPSPTPTVYPEVEAFKKQAEAFVKDSACPPGSPIFGTKKRSIEKRDLDFSEALLIPKQHFGFLDMVYTLWTMTRTPTDAQQLNMDQYDELIGEPFNLNLDYMREFYRPNGTTVGSSSDPIHGDPINTEFSILCLGQQARDELDSFRAAQLETGCIEYSELDSSTDGGHDELRRRNIVTDFGLVATTAIPAGSTAMPTTGQIMRAIIDGRIQLLDLHLIQQPTDVILEVVYDIREHPEFQQYRGDQSDPPDLFVVLHFHVTRVRISPGNDIVRFPFITAWNMHHSNDVISLSWGPVNQRRTFHRVVTNPRNSRNTRADHPCPSRGGWLAGSNRPQGAALQTEFFMHLRDERILDGWVFEDVITPSGQFIYPLERANGTTGHGFEVGSYVPDPDNPNVQIWEPGYWNDPMAEIYATLHPNGN